MPRGAEGPRYATRCRGTARCHVVQRDRATSRRADGPRDATRCRGTARYYGVQRNRAMPRGAETARSYGVQRNRATPRRAEGPWCRGTARRHVVQRDRAMPRGAEGPHDATARRGKSCKLKSFCDRDVDRSTTRRFGPASGRTGRALPVPPRTRRRRTDSEYAECFCVCSLQKKYHIRIDTGDTFHVHSKKHCVDDDDDLMITVIAMLSFVFDKAQ